MNQLQQLRERIEEGAETEVVHNLVALMHSLKVQSKLYLFIFLSGWFLYDRTML